MKHGISGRALVALLAVVLVIGCAAGGTVAYLATKTETVTNTFTVGNINVELSETNRDYKIVPGVDIEKDPKATVKANSEACYLFVKVDEKNWPEFKEADGSTRKVKYEIAENWVKLENVEDTVYYRMVPSNKDDQEFSILKDNKVAVSLNLTKDEVDTVTTNPTLAFTVYAVQQEKVETAAAAWNLVKPQN